MIEFNNCYKDVNSPEGRDLPDFLFQSKEMTIENCAEFCGNNGGIVFGLQFRSECWCSVPEYAGDF